VVKDGNGYAGLAFHLPCALPQVLPHRVTPEQQAEVWRAVHEVLDRQMTRTGDGQ